MNRYRVLLPVLVNGEHGQGDEFDHEFASADDEAANLQSGLLEIVPREYRVLLGRVFETDAGGTFTRALTIGQEAHLVNAGFIERLDPEPDPKPEKPAPRERKKVNS